MRDKRILIIPALLVVALIAFLVVRNRNDDDRGITASGTIEATEADLGFQVGGRVLEVAVREGDQIQQGDVLARLEQDELRARRDAANAQVQAAHALLAELEHGARPQESLQARAALDAARQRAQEAESVLRRTRRLYEGGAVSKEAFEHAETAFEVARAQVEQVRQQAAIVDTGTRPERLAAQRALVQQAEAVVTQTTATINNSVIVAPFAGIITVRHREPGETVAAGLPVITVMNPADRWVRIYVREDQVGRVHVGQTATITSDSHPGRAFNGRVTFIASQAEFTPRNVQTAEERVKLVYAVKVAISGDGAIDLKPGVPADVSLAGLSK
jgi:HlyD family secretion protein